MEEPDYSKYFLIGKGTYACTYGSSNPEDPLVQIKNEYTAKKNSTRIQGLGLSMINEPQEKLIYPKMNIKELPASLVMDTCDLEGNLKVVEIPNGGTDLYKLKVSSEDIYVFFSGFVNIFEGILLLHSHKIAHLDVKPMNMVGKKNPDGTYNLRLIDFGFSKKTDIKSNHFEFYEYTINNQNNINKGKCTKPYNYSYWSYDLRLLNRYLFENLCGGNIYDDIESYRLMLHDAFYTTFMISTLKTDLVTSFKDYIIGDNISLTLLKSDVFALGVSLYIIWQRLTGYGMSTLNKIRYNRDRDIGKGISIKAGEQVKLPEGWKMREEVGLSKVYFESVTHNLMFWDITKINTCDAEIEASKKVFALVKNMCDPNPFIRLSLEEAKGIYIETVLPAIKTAYSTVPDVEHKSRVGENIRALLKKVKGGSRRRRKTTKRNNKRYVKPKKKRTTKKH